MALKTKHRSIVFDASEHLSAQRQRIKDDHFPSSACFLPCDVKRESTLNANRGFHRDKVLEQHRGADSFPTKLCRMSHRFSVRHPVLATELLMGRSRVRILLLE